MKGYFVFGVYYKIRKRQYGNLWNTQLVTLHRDEVQRLEEHYKNNVSKKPCKPVGVFISELEKSELNTKESDRVTYAV